MHSNTDQTFHFGGFVWDVDCAMEYAAKHSPREVPLPTQLLGLVRVDSSYAADHPYPDEPIIVAPIGDENGWFGMPIDGWHRIKHWHDRGAETIQAVFLDPQESYDCLIGGEHHYRKTAKLAEPGIRLRKSRRKRRKRDG